MRILALLTALCACQSASPVPDPVAIRQEIVAAREQVWRAWLTGDSTALVEILPDSMVGMAETTEQIIATAIGFRDAGNRLVALDFSDSEFMVTDTMAVVVSRYRVETVRNDSTTVLQGRAIEIFVREAGRWVNPHWTLSDESDAAAPEA